MVKKIFALLIVNIILVYLVVILYSQGAGSGTPDTLRVMTDSNGNLVVTAAATATPNSQPTVFNNLRLKTDASGNLLVAPSSLIAGTGTTTYHPDGILFTPLVADNASLADTNYKCVTLGTIIANTITANGDQIVVETEFLEGSTAATTTLTFNVGGTCVADGTGFSGGYNFATSTGMAGNSASYLTVARLIRTTVGNFRGSMSISGTTTSSTGGAAVGAGAATETGNLALALAFKNSSSSPVTLKTAVVLFRPAP